jgi:hypothetical protein
VIGGLEELRELELWFAERGHELDYELATAAGVADPDWMAIVVRLESNKRTPAYITGYGATKLDAARSAQRRFLRSASGLQEPPVRTA